MKHIGVVGVVGGWSTERLLAALQSRGVETHLVDMARVRLDLATGLASQEGLILNELDALVVKKIAASYSPAALDRMEMLRHLHRRGLPVFSNPGSMLRLIDRLSCTVALRLGDIPMPETTVTEDLDAAVAAVETYGQAVAKPLYSSKARGMTVLTPGPDLRHQAEAFQADGNPVMYLQRLVDHPGHDLGVTFLGGEYLATYARLGSGTSWNTTTRAGGRYVAVQPSSEIIDLARKAQALFDMAFTCVDVVETPGGPLVYEVSAFGGFRGLLEAHGLDAAGLYADHVLERLP